MASYEFECRKCETVYTVQSLMSEKERTCKKAKCPSCKSVRKKEVFYAPSFNFSNPQNTDRWNSDSTGHDYRFKYNAPNVKKEREMAEKASHVGANPYPKIDDISGGKYFGKVK